MSDTLNTLGAKKKNVTQDTNEGRTFASLGIGLSQKIPDCFVYPTPWAIERSSRHC